MQNRRDLYQAHRLMTQRVGLALLQGEPDIAESPMRRHAVGAFAGVMVALLVAAVFGIWGVLAPGGARGLDQPGKLIIEKETGTKYIYDANTRKMFPVANYASAMLALNQDKVERRTVSRKSLAHFERGPMIGIVGAPDSLPDTKQLIRGPWSVCVREAAGTNGVRREFTALAAGRDVGGRSLGENEAVVVKSGGQAWVIWKDHRMQLGVPAGGVTAITGGPDAVEVPPAWLNAMPAAGNFSAPDVPGRGAARQGPGGRPARVGQIFKADTGGQPNWYVMLADGLAQISETQAQLLLRSPDTVAAYPGGQGVKEIPVDAASAQQAVGGHKPLIDPALPPTLPKFASWDTSTPLCSVFPTGSAVARLTLGGSLPPPSAATLGAGSSGSGNAVDQVVLPPGGAALMSLVAGGGQNGGQAAGSGSLSLVNDQGVRFALPSPDVAKKLGYDPTKAAPVPSPVIQLIPTGPALDPAKARNPVPTTGG
ncbi:type VII secretion protein EccB [Actinomadura rupiterrae]|uniref:type VII secretion protein EccB n=1 Tax=Actinomadura rupiterrae TaxID=559627 RepID=UPI0020A46EFD|nr:type VII secretion protein EccB [Actinomadura rupiterrae]MCP2343649.1 type VII secretion protein EccB [Actinomadura rupiterrae]